MTKLGSNEWLEQIGVRLLEECDRAAKRLGARGCVMIAMFEDGEGGVHCVDAGRAPRGLEEVYDTMAMAHRLNEISTRTVQ